jgi:hypothetical protein
VDFLKYIENQADDVVKVDIFIANNNHNFKRCRPLKDDNYKDEGIMPYKYYFMPENNSEYNYITEKLWEPILCETLCFYWGCPNVSEYIDPRAYIQLDLDDFPNSFNTIKTAILNNEWERRVDIIRREKQKVLGYYGVFPTLERIIKHEFKFNYNPTDEEVKYNKYFSFCIDDKPKNVAFIHSCNVGNNDIIEKLCNIIISSGLIDKLDWVYINNLGIEISIDYPKFRVNNYSTDTGLFESPTINLIHTFSKFNKNVNILYLHTKGISYNPIPKTITDWTDLMLYFLVEKYNGCLTLLENNDTVGNNCLEKPHKHYSGNFWWARSDYLATLDECVGDKHSVEWWILSNPKVKNATVHNSSVNHYLNEYPKENYVI